MCDNSPGKPVSERLQSTKYKLQMISLSLSGVTVTSTGTSMVVSQLEHQRRNGWTIRTAIRLD